jgi:hypothetical protein
MDDMQFGLSSDGESISLYNLDGDLIDRVSYLPSSPWPASPYNTAATLELISAEADNNEASSWGAGLAGGTPGERNSVSTESRKYLANNLSVTCVPSPFTEHATLLFQSKAQKQFHIVVSDLQGRVVKKLHGQTAPTGNNRVDLFFGNDNITSGMYVVSVRVGGAVKTIKTIKK